MTSPSAETGGVVLFPQPAKSTNALHRQISSSGVYQAMARVHASASHASTYTCTTPFSSHEETMDKPGSPINPDGRLGYRYVHVHVASENSTHKTCRKPHSHSPPSVRLHVCMHRHTNEVRNSFQLRRGNNAMQCNRFRNWEDFPSYSSSRSSISNMQYIIQCNACAPEGRPTTQATTLVDLPPHQTRHFLQLPINGIPQAKNNTTLSLSLHTLKNSVSAQPCACHAMLFRTWAGTSKRTLRLSYSPPRTLIEFLGGYMTTRESVMYCTL